MSLGSGALIAQRIAVEVQERLSMMQREGRLPAQETCDLIVFDRYANDLLLDEIFLGGSLQPQETCELIVFDRFSMQLPPWNMT